MPISPVPRSVLNCLRGPFPAPTRQGRPVVPLPTLLCPPLALRSLLLMIRYTAILNRRLQSQNVIVTDWCGYWPVWLLTSVVTDLWGYWPLCGQWPVWLSNVVTLQSTYCPVKIISRAIPVQIVHFPCAHVPLWYCPVWLLSTALTGLCGFCTLDYCSVCLFSAWLPCPVFRNNYPLNVVTIQCNNGQVWLLTALLFVSSPHIAHCGHSSV
jgi:hypothetical protein